MKFVTVQPSRDPAVRAMAGWIARQLQGYERPVQILFQDGTTVQPENCHRPTLTLALRTGTALASMFRPPLERSLGESYIFGEVDALGNFQEVFPLAEHFLAKHWTFSDRLRFLWHRLIGPHFRSSKGAADGGGPRHSPARDRSVVRSHYDLPAAFYQLWLDRRMVYSCAYFTHGNEDLDEAQANKLDYICRKLRLKRGDRVLDIGCGWGGFALYAAQYYGVAVVGITLSHRQAEIGRERIAAAGLTQQCTISVTDCRDLHDEEAFDKIVSVGMVEHVGLSQLPRYFHQAHRLLKPGGVFLNHGIATTDGDSRLGTFADRYVFPDAEVIPLHQVIAAAEGQTWEVRDVESLREHYALTLEQWVKRLEREYVRAVDLVGETTYRVWRLYLDASARWFRQGRLSLYQTLCAKPVGGQSRLPLTRADWCRSVATNRTYRQRSLVS